ncbi:MAG: ferrous iron transport protein A [Deltaproteobacteria bacterium]|nr:ferrous iron transport protein A [Deltaproteobacteria bacterium]
MFGCFGKRGGRCWRGLNRPNCGVLPLSRAPQGCRIRVEGIDGGRQLCARMAALGIYPGVEMELLCASCGSPCLIKLRGSTLSLGAGVSEKILVTAA